MIPLYIAAACFLLSALVTVIGVSRARHLPGEVEEDQKAMTPPEPIEGVHGVYIEPDHVRAKREHYLQIRGKIFQASRRERAEHEAAKRGGV